MRTKLIRTLLLAMGLAGYWGAAAFAAESQFNETVSVGEDAPEFAEVPGIDGKSHALSEYKDAKAIVVVFTCNHCPVAVAYEDRLIALQNVYEKQGVRFVAICSSFEAGNSLDELRERAESKKFTFPYLRDGDQEIARAYGASHTPHVFVLDGDRKIAYMGAIDDDEIAEKASKHYLRDAIESLIKGKEPAVQESQQFGCRIRFKRRPSKS